MCKGFRKAPLTDGRIGTQEYFTDRKTDARTGDSRALDRNQVPPTSDPHLLCDPGQVTSPSLPTSLVPCE